MKGHLKHLLMCAPMIIVGAILIAGGANVAAALLPLAVCMLMMWAMMSAMGHGGGHDHGGGPGAEKR